MGGDAWIESDAEMDLGGGGRILGSLCCDLSDVFGVCYSAKGLPETEEKRFLMLRIGWILRQKRIHA